MIGQAFVCEWKTMIPAKSLLKEDKVEKSQTAQDPMEETQAAFLDLSEPLQRVVVNGPDGKPYELRTAEEFSIEDEHLLRAELDIFSELQQKRTLKPDERASLRLRLDKTFDSVLIADDTQKKLFNDKQRQKVLMFFRTRWAREDAEVIRGAIKDLRIPEDEASASTMES